MTNLPSRKGSKCLTVPDNTEDWQGAYTLLYFETFDFSTSSFTRYLPPTFQGDSSEPPILFPDSFPKIWSLCMLLITVISGLLLFDFKYILWFHSLHFSVHFFLVNRLHSKTWKHASIWKCKLVNFISKCNSSMYLCLFEKDLSGNIYKYELNT